MTAHGGRSDSRARKAPAARSGSSCRARGAPAPPTTARACSIVEDDPELATLLAEGLALDGLEVECVDDRRDGPRARARAAAGRHLPRHLALAGKLDGWQVLAKLKASPATARVPVIVCTRRERAAARRRRSARRKFVAKPVHGRAAARGRRPAALERVRSSVLVVDDDIALRRLVVETLARDGSELREAAERRRGARDDRRARPGRARARSRHARPRRFGVLERLLERAETRQLPVVVLTGRDLTRGRAQPASPSATRRCSRRARTRAISCAGSSARRSAERVRAAGRAPRLRAAAAERTT